MEEYKFNKDSIKVEPELNEEELADLEALRKDTMEKLEATRLAFEQQKALIASLDAKIAQRKVGPAANEN